MKRTSSPSPSINVCEVMPDPPQSNYVRVLQQITDTINRPIKLGPQKSLSPNRTQRFLEDSQKVSFISIGSRSRDMGDNSSETRQSRIVYTEQSNNKEAKNNSRLTNIYRQPFTKTSHVTRSQVTIQSESPSKRALYQSTLAANRSSAIDLESNYEKSRTANNTSQKNSQGTNTKYFCQLIKGSNVKNYQCHSNYKGSLNSMQNTNTLTSPSANTSTDAAQKLKEKLMFHKMGCFNSQKQIENRQKEVRDFYSKQIEKVNFTFMMLETVINDAKSTIITRLNKHLLAFLDKSNGEKAKIQQFVEELESQLHSKENQKQSDSLITQIENYINNLNHKNYEMYRARDNTQAIDQIKQLVKETIKISEGSIKLLVNPFFQNLNDPRGYQPSQQDQNNFLKENDELELEMERIIDDFRSPKGQSPTDHQFKEFKTMPSVSTFENEPHATRSPRCDTLNNTRKSPSNLDSNRSIQSTLQGLAKTPQSATANKRKGIQQTKSLYSQTHQKKLAYKQNFEKENLGPQNSQQSQKLQQRQQQLKHVGQLKSQEFTRQEIDYLLGSTANNSPSNYLIPTTKNLHPETRRISGKQSQQSAFGRRHSHQVQTCRNGLERNIRGEAQPYLRSQVITEGDEQNSQLGTNQSKDIYQIYVEDKLNNVRRDQLQSQQDKYNNYFFDQNNNAMKNFATSR